MCDLEQSALVLQGAFVLVQRILNQSKGGAKIETNRAKIHQKCFNFTGFCPSFTTVQKVRYTWLSKAKIGASILNFINFA